MNDRLSIFTQACVKKKGKKKKEYGNYHNEIYSGNSLLVCICLITACITNGSHKWQIDITLLRALIRSLNCTTDAKSWDWRKRNFPSQQCSPVQGMMSVYGIRLISFTLIHQAIGTDWKVSVLPYIKNAEFALHKRASQYNSVYHN